MAALLGYYWTALQLSIRFHLTAVFLFVLLVVFDLFSRWILLANRRLAIERARQRRDAHAAKLREALETEETGASIPPLVVEESDLATVKTQTMSVGDWKRAAGCRAWSMGIWADIMPAAGILRQVELWNTTRDVAVTVPDPQALNTFRPRLKSSP